MRCSALVSEANFLGVLWESLTSWFALDFSKRNLAGLQTIDGSVDIGDEKSAFYYAQDNNSNQTTWAAVIGIAY